MHRLTTLLAVLLLLGATTLPACAGERDEAASPVDQPLSGTVHVRLATSMGDITVALDADSAPVTVHNFVRYVAAGHYDNTVFHRVIPGFMIQGGGYDSELNEKDTGAPIRNEAANGLLNVRGSIAMARTADPDSATSQFFINTVDNDYLNRSERSAGYAVFGQVVAGMEVVAAIEMASTHRVGPFDDVPVTPIVIHSAERIEQ